MKPVTHLQNRQATKERPPSILAEKPDATGCFQGRMPIMSNSFYHWCNQVKNAAENNWPDILQALGGLDDKQVNSSRSAQNKGTSCPVCSDGVDRYNFADKGAGLWYCRHCGGGDGIDMLRRMHAWPFNTVMQKIAHRLGMETYNDEYIDPEVQRLAQQRAKQRKDESLRQKQQEDQQKTDMAEKMAGLAQKQWEKGTPARTLHPYLGSHCLPPFDLRENLSLQTRPVPDDPADQRPGQVTQHSIHQGSTHHDGRKEEIRKKVL